MILYLHGFLSSGESAKAQWFDHKTQSCLSVPFSRPTWPQGTPDQSAAFFESLFASAQANRTPIQGVMGSSLGGFWARWLGARYGLSSVWINPALALESVFAPYFGDYTHPHTGEAIGVDQDYLQALKGYEVSAEAIGPSLILLDGDDEIIDSNQTRLAYQGIPQAEVAWFDGGDHAFQHCDQAWSKVAAFWLENGVGLSVEC
jgi:predicted esterase YcpF (UPF0227 family)